MGNDPQMEISELLQSNQIDMEQYATNEHPPFIDDHRGLPGETHGFMTRA
jgi:hypothetical protein